MIGSTNCAITIVLSEYNYTVVSYQKSSVYNISRKFWFSRWNKLSPTDDDEKSFKKIFWGKNSFCRISSFVVKQALGHHISKSSYKTDQKGFLC